jgi:hypothetical protein
MTWLHIRASFIFVWLLRGHGFTASRRLSVFIPPIRRVATCAWVLSARHQAASQLSRIQLVGWLISCRAVVPSRDLEVVKLHGARGLPVRVSDGWCPLLILLAQP